MKNCIFKKKIFINSNNKQITISLPKKELPKIFTSNPSKIKSIKLKLDSWEEFD